MRGSTRKSGFNFKNYLREYAVWYSVRVKVREAIRMLERDGWFIVRQKGSHRQFHHEHKRGTVTVAGSPGVDVPIGTMNSIVKQAGLKGTS